MVLKHHGLKVAEANDKNLLVEGYFGSARLGGRLLQATIEGAY